MFVTVIIPTYNRVGMVCRAIDSVLNQSHEDFELLVIDDGSQDETSRILSYYKDERLSVIPVSHGGVARARNIGAHLAHAEWLALLDSDDLWLRHKLKEQIYYHQQHPEILISQTDDFWIRNGKFMNKHKKHTIFAGDLFAASVVRCMISSSSVMLHRSVLAEAGGWDETFPACEDYDLWLRVTARHKVGLVDKVVASKFGGHPDQLSQMPVLDRYRLRALEKIRASGILNQMQLDCVEKEIVVKRMIVERDKNTNF